jgi:hypothetical protein
MTQRYAGPFGGAALPSAGGPGDQPAALMDAFATLDRLSRGKDGR